MLAAVLALGADAYVPPRFGVKSDHDIRFGVQEPLRSTSASAETSAAGNSLGVTEGLEADAETLTDTSIPPEVASLAPEEIKGRLIDLLPRMTGKAEEFQDIESYVNALEDKYVPVQTLGFLNMAMEGDWQLLFSTNRLGVPNTKLRLRELKQCIATDDLKGAVTNVARWDLAEDEGEFDASGTFSVKCSYEINQGARMTMSLDDNVLELAKGSKVPQDVEGLVGMLHRAMPKELFDPSELAMDTTYLDANLRIIRFTGARFEGIRNIFVRSGSVEINPE